MVKLLNCVQPDVDFIIRNLCKCCY